MSSLKQVSPYDYTVAMLNQSPYASLMPKTQEVTLPQPKQPEPLQEAVIAPKRQLYPSPIMNNVQSSSGGRDQDYISKFKELMDDRSRGVSGMEDELKKLQEKEVPWYDKADFSGLSVFMDPNQREAFLTAMPRGDGQKIKDDKVQAFKQAISKSKDDLTNDQLTYLKLKDDNKLQSQMLAQQARRGNFEDSQAFKLLGEIQKDSDIKAKPLYEATQQTNALESAVQSGDLTRLEQVIGNFARNVGGNVGALSDQDIARQLPPSFTLSVERAKRYVDEGAAIPKELADQIVKGVGDFKKAVHAAYKNKMETTRKDFIQRSNLLGIPQGVSFANDVVDRKLQDIGGQLGQTSPQQSGPKVGNVESGHRFKGGDPSDPNNWEVVR